MEGVKMKFSAVFLLAGVSLFGQASKSALDKPTLEAYVRYCELLRPQVSMKIDDPKPSSTLNGYFDVWVHLAYNGAVKDEMYYVSTDGRNIVKGDAYDVTKSPFQANVDQLKPEQQPAFGAGPNAAVKLVVFGDFECPVCQKEETELRQKIPAEFGDKVRVSFHDFPLTSIHPWAMKASVVGRCMAHQGQPVFWDYHDWIYQNQSAITVENLDAKVQEFSAGREVDPAKLTSCLADKSPQAEVNNSILIGHNLAVSATPTLFINGRKIEGAMDWDNLEQLLKFEIEVADRGSAR